MYVVLIYRSTVASSRGGKSYLMYPFAHRQSCADSHRRQPYTPKRNPFIKRDCALGNRPVLPGQNGLITYCYFRPTLWARHDWPIQFPAHARALTPERSQQAHPSHLRAILFWDRPWDLWGPWVQDRPWDLCEDRKNAAKATVLAHWFHPR